MSKHAFAIRPLVPADWEVFSALRLEALRECSGMFGASYENEKGYAPEKWQELLTSRGRCYFGLFNEADLVGITGIATDSGDATQGLLVASYIKPAYRGRGLSDLLYQARIAWAKAYKPWKGLIVSHRADNEPSRRANQRHGFVFTHTSSRTWPDGKVADEWHYKLDLETLRQTT